MNIILSGGYHLMDAEAEIVLALLHEPVSADRFDQADEAFIGLVNLGVIEHEGNLVSFNLERYLVISNSKWDPTQ